MSLRYLHLDFTRHWTKKSIYYALCIQQNCNTDYGKVMRYVPKHLECILRHNNDANDTSTTEFHEFMNQQNDCTKYSHNFRIENEFELCLMMTSSTFSYSTMIALPWNIHYTQLNREKNSMRGIWKRNHMTRVYVCSGSNEYDEHKKKRAHNELEWITKHYIICAEREREMKSVLLFT